MAKSELPQLQENVKGIARTMHKWNDSTKITVKMLRDLMNQLHQTQQSSKKFTDSQRFSSKQAEHFKKALDTLEKTLIKQENQTEKLRKAKEKQLATDKRLAQEAADKIRLEEDIALMKKQELQHKKLAKEKEKLRLAEEKFNTTLEIHIRRLKDAGVNTATFVARNKQLIQAAKSSAVAMDVLKRRFKEVGSAQKRLDGGLDRGILGVRNFRNASKGLGMTFSVLRSKMLLVAFGFNLIARTIQRTLAAPIRIAAEFETSRKRLDALYGSTKRGTQAFQVFNRVAAKTPFTLQGVVNAGAQLKAFGLNAEQTIMLASDLAAFMGTDIVDAANAMGRAFAGGAGAADILRERGILNLIKTTQGITDLKDTTLPEFRKALIATLQDPSVGIKGATETMAKTFVGSMSNMRDAISRAADAIAKFYLPEMKALIGFTTNAATATERFFKSLKRGIGVSEDFDPFLSFRETIPSTIEGAEKLLTDLENQLADARANIKKDSELIGQSFEISPELGEGAMQITGIINETSSEMGKLGLIVGEANPEMQALINTLLDGGTVIDEQLLGALDNMNKSTIDFANNIDPVDTNILALVEKIKILKEELEKLRESTDDSKNGFQEFWEKNREGAELLVSSFSNMTSAMQDNLNQRMKSEMDTLKNSTAFQRASKDKQKQMEEEKTKEFANERLKLWKFQKASNFAEAGINIATAVTKAMADTGILAPILAPAIATMGAFQLAAIANTKPPQFARGGLIGGRRHSQGGTMIEAEQGEFIMSRSAVQTIGTDTLNRMNQGGSGGSVTVNVSGNVMSQDFVEGELSEQIREAVRRGTDFGIS